MENPTLHFIQSLLISLKSGQSAQYFLDEYQSTFPKTWGELYLSKTHPIPPSSVEFELQILLERALKGLPITKSLEALLVEAHENLKSKIEEHTQKAPFLALLPLFLFQVPSLFLIFLYPILHSFLQELR